MCLSDFPKTPLALRYGTGSRFLCRASVHKRDQPTTSSKTRQLSQRDQQRIKAATARAYFSFCGECSAYHHTLANYLILMDWIDERRIEMQAEGRRYWVPSVRDFEQAMRDCWDDLVKQ